MGLVRMYKHFLHKSLIIFSPCFLAALGQEIRQKNSSSLSHTDQKHSITLKISLTLLSIKTNIRSSFSLERALLCRIALEKDLFIASLFSIYRGQSTFFDVRPPQKNKINKIKTPLALTSLSTLIPCGSAARDTKISSLRSSSLQLCGSSFRHSCRASRALSNLAFTEKVREWNRQLCCKWWGY